MDNFEFEFRTDQSEYSSQQQEKVFLTEDSSNYNLGDQSTDPEIITKKQINNSRDVKSMAQKRAERKEKMAYINHQKMVESGELQRKIEEEKQKQKEIEKQKKSKKRKSTKNDKYIGMTPAEKKLAKKQEQMMKNRISAQVSRDKKKQEREEMSQQLEELQNKIKQLEAQLESAKGVCRYCGNRFQGTQVSTSEENSENQSTQDNFSTSQNTTDQQNQFSTSSSCHNEKEINKDSIEFGQLDHFSNLDNLFEKEPEFLNFEDNFENNTIQNDNKQFLNYNDAMNLESTENITSSDPMSSTQEEDDTDQYIRTGNNQNTQGVFSPFTKKMLNFTFFAMFTFLFLNNSDGDDYEQRSLFTNQNGFFQQIPQIYEDQDTLAMEFDMNKRRYKDLVQTLDEYLEFEGDEQNDQDFQKIKEYRQKLQQKMDDFIGQFQQQQGEQKQQKQQQSLNKNQSLRERFQNKQKRQQQEEEKFEKVKDILDVENSEIYYSDYDTQLKERSELSTQESSENYSEIEVEEQESNNGTNNEKYFKNLKLIMDSNQLLDSNILDHQQYQKLMVNQNFTQKQQQINQIIQQGENLLQEYNGEDKDSQKVWFSLNCIITEIKRLQKENSNGRQQQQQIRQLNQNVQL